MIEALRILQKQQKSIALALLDTNTYPCSEDRAESGTCLTREERYPITALEKGTGEQPPRRPFYAYNPDRMCRSCRAYWFASMAVNELHEMLCWATKTANRTGEHA